MIQLQAAWAAVKAGRGILTLLAIAGAAAFLWIKWGEVTRERDRAIADRDGICAAAAPADKQPCLARVKHLAAFERDTLRATAELLAKGQRDQNDKSAADLAASRQSAERTRVANEKMEKADAQVAGDRAGADWFGAVNDVAGLRRRR